MMKVQERIKKLVGADSVFLFMKGEPQNPQCGFSARVVQVLNALQIPFKTFNVLDDEEIRQGIKVYADWPTIPQLYVKGEFVGGCDIVEEKFQTGELEKEMADFKPKNVS